MSAGMVSARPDVHPEEALARLRSREFGASAAVGDVAGDVVSRRLRSEAGGGADA